MPIYEYDCSACGKSFERLQKLEDPAPDSCELCAGGPVHKRMSRTGFILKGAGWYVTDFLGGSHKPAAASPDAPASEAESSPATTSETKPAEAKPAETKPAESKPEPKALTS